MRFKTLTAAALLVTGALASTSVSARVDAMEAASETQLFELSTTVEAGDDKEVSVLLDASHLKLALVTLRRGTTLPMHATPVPATVQVLQGAGILHVAGEVVNVSAGSLVSLAAGAEHDVVPAPGTTMRLLVHYLRGAPDSAASPHAEHDH